MTEKEKNEQENSEENPFIQETEVEESEISEKDNELNSKYEKLENDFNAKNDQYIRLAADFENFRKRQAQEREGLLKYGAEGTLTKLLPVLDSFERAQKSFASEDSIEKMKESFDALQKQFLETLEKIGLEKIETTGKEFDPKMHEAVMQTPTEEHPDNTIIAELQSGYKLCDKVVRPALVNVASN